MNRHIHTPFDRLATIWAGSSDRQDNQALIAVPLHKERRPDRWVKLSPSITPQSTSALSQSGTASVSGSCASHYLPVIVIVASHQAECVACHVSAETVAAYLPRYTPEVLFQSPPRDWSQSKCPAETWPEGLNDPESPTKEFSVRGIRL